MLRALLASLRNAARNAAALIAVVFAFGRWQRDGANSSGWFYCRLAAKSGCRDQCQVCREDGERMRARAAGMFPAERHQPRWLTLTILAMLLIIAVIAVAALIGLLHVAHTLGQLN